MDDFLREIELWQITSRHRPLKGGNGAHQGGGRGDSLDFYGHSPYMAGQDIRKIDWPAYARTENLYVKSFNEDRQLHIKVLLDTSASMKDVGMQKWLMARLIGLGLSYLALKQGDQLSFFTLQGDIEAQVEAGIGMNCFFNLAERINKMEPQGVADFKRIKVLPRQKGDVTFVISDFFSRDTEALLHILCGQGQDITLVQTLTPAELSPNIPEELKLVDAETGQARQIYLSQRIREKYEQRIRAHISSLEAVCFLRGARYELATPDRSPAKILQHVLRR